MNLSDSTAVMEVTPQTERSQALARLCALASGDTGQARRVANFLLAWQNTQANGGWDPADLWNVDAGIADDILSVLRLVRDSRRSGGDLGCGAEMQRIWRLWRGSAIQCDRTEHIAQIEAIWDVWCYYLRVLHADGSAHEDRYFGEIGMGTTLTLSSPDAAIRAVVVEGLNPANPEVDRLNSIITVRR